MLVPQELHQTLELVIDRADQRVLREVRLEALVPSAITSKPATRDRLKTGHFVSFGDVIDYFELESFVKLAAL